MGRKRLEWKKNRVVERKREAAERQAAANKRSDLDQLKRLVTRGHGHCREAQELAEKIMQSDNAQAKAYAQAVKQDKAA